jgi:hypothetical protein
LRRNALLLPSRWQVSSSLDTLEKHKVPVEGEDFDFLLQPVVQSGGTYNTHVEKPGLASTADAFVSDVIIFSAAMRWKQHAALVARTYFVDPSPVQQRVYDALHEIQFGHVRRPTHASMEYDASRFEVCNQRWTALAEESRGAAVLNDCKYGVNVEGNSINLTLLRAPLAPDMTADKGEHEFTYAFHCWNQAAFCDAGIVQSGYDLNVPLTVQPGDAAALAHALRTLAADADLRRRLGEAGRRRVQDDFSVENMVHKTLAVYELVLQRRGQRT